MNIKNITRPTKSRMTSLRLTEENYQWLKKKKYVLSKILSEAIKELQQQKK